MHVSPIYQNQRGRGGGVRQRLEVVIGSLPPFLCGVAVPVLPVFRALPHKSCARATRLSKFYEVLGSSFGVPDGLLYSDDVP